MSIFIHVGLPKTGTTFLQRKVFPKMDVNFICKENLATVNLSKKINLISDEELSFKIDMFGINKYEVADRIHKLFPDAKIIVVFRDKESWLKSMYNQYLKSFYRPYMPFEKYKEIMIKMGAFDFKKYEDYLKTLFPEVLVLQFEDMKKDIYGFVSKICDFVGVDMPEFDPKPINVSLNKKQLAFIQFVKARNIPLWWKKKIIELFLFVFNHESYMIQGDNYERESIRNNPNY